MCGENISASVAAWFASGSSPRVRGKLLHDCFNSSIIRLIPACAGKTLRLSLRWGVARAHPRVCGENAVERIPEGCPLGSSPRWRGKQRRRQGYPQRRRLIPALAGKTPSGKPLRNNPRAHPRAGGENESVDLPYAHGLGSSPRWRGKLERQTTILPQLRLIPALAGKTSLPAFTVFVISAHPRAGGENEKIVNNITRRFGSSPRWRGKHLHFWGLFRGLGLIPALAGKTGYLRDPMRTRTAHPRAGGENVC